MNHNKAIMSFYLFIDLKFHSGYIGRNLTGGAADEFRKNCLFTNHDLLTHV